MALIEDLYKQATGLLDSRTSDPSLQPSIVAGRNIPNNIGTTSNLNSQPSIVAGRNIVTQPIENTLPSTNQQKKGLNISNAQSKQFLGLDLKQIEANWKEKGGYEGLMANPAFQLGLAIMQSSARGKSVGADLFDNAAKAGAISAQYAERLKARSTVTGPVTQEQRDEVAAVLAEDNYYKPGILDRLKTGNQQAKFREGLDNIYDKAMKLAKKEARTSGGKEVRFGRKHIRQALKDLEKEGKLKKRDPSFFGLIGGTIEATGGIEKREMGGPVNKDQSYVVGEKGAEVFIPQVSGKIINNDDAKVINMLLESNPQLKNVSRARAVKILKARFPDYF
jgi:hypothetical protein